MKTVSAMTVRRSFGGLLDEVRLKAERVIIERDGKPVAMLAPLDPTPDAAADRSRQLAALDRLCGMAEPSARGRNAARWLAGERGRWAKRDR